MEPRLKNTSFKASSFFLLAALAASAQLADPHAAFWKTPAPAEYRVRIETSQGEILLEVHRDWAPAGADRFYNLVRAGFYNDSRFFRVISPRFVQFGIAGDPRIARVWRNETIDDDPVKRSEERRVGKECRL